ncbi:MAG: hypothetical protein WA864_00585 [Acetobacteraceae bacterium]
MPRHLRLRPQQQRRTPGQPARTPIKVALPHELAEAVTLVARARDASVSSVLADVVAAHFSGLRS